MVWDDAFPSFLIGLREGLEAGPIVYLIDPVSNAVYGEVEGIAPGTPRALIATVGTGSYAWRCVPNGGKAVTSAAVRVGSGGTTRAVLPVSEKGLSAPLAAYRKYVDQDARPAERHRRQEARRCP
ncbi:hypothetical protein [Streptomyces sp. NBC_00996]|uniref:hypothetical protein n=1 Tax=Streptomyces sp. NBC_00996 TaxID=2903710 RepID=UPI0038651A96